MSQMRILRKHTLIMKTITKYNDELVAVITTSESQELIKKSSLEGQRKTLIEEHEKALALIDEKLAVFK